MAIARAKELDEILAKTGKTVGPLHGVPISVKEHVNMKGYPCNCSFVAWIDNIAEDDAPLLKLLYAAGGVFYVRTTQPQTLMHAATSFAIFGDTTNPYNTNLTCGGSSGGEGAIAGMKASVLSDLGDIDSRSWELVPILAARSVFLQLTVASGASVPQRNDFLYKD
jgi:amidase